MTDPAPNPARMSPRDIPMGTCERCGQQTRAWNLVDIDGAPTCLQCRTAITAKATRRKRFVTVAAVLAALALFVIGTATAVRYVLYVGSPEASLRRFVTEMRKDPDSVTETLGVLMRRDEAEISVPGGDTAVDDPSQGGPLGRYAAITPIRQQMSGAVRAHQVAHLVGTSDASRQLIDFYAPSQLTVFTVSQCARNGKTVTRTGNTAQCQAVYTGPTKEMSTEYTVRFTMTRVQGPDGAYWRITSIDNIPEVVQTFMAGQ